MFRLAKTFALFILVGHMLGCCCSGSISLPSALTIDRAARFSPIHLVRGTAVVIPGLNNRPDALDSISRLLSEAGYDTLRLVLPGHGTEQNTTDPAQDWLATVKEGFKSAKSYAKDRPFIVVAYSLGALLSVLASNMHDVPHPDRMLLLAPALTPRGLTALLNAGNIPIVSSLPVPSMAPRSIRRWCSIPIRWYGAVGELVTMLSAQRDYHSLRRIPTRVLLSSKDELVSLERTKHWIDDAGLDTKWSLIPLTMSNLPDHGLAHNLIELNQLDEETFQSIRIAIEWITGKAT